MVRKWLWRRRHLIAGFVGIISLWILDVAQAVPELSNGFWTMDAEQGFHLALWVAGATFIFVAVFGTD